MQSRLPQVVVLVAITGGGHRRLGDDKWGFIGPFPFSKVMNPAADRLEFPGTMRVHPTFHLSKMKPVKTSPLFHASKPPPLPQIVDGGPVYTVKRLLAVGGRRHQFLGNWEGYGLFPLHLSVCPTTPRDKSSISPSSCFSAASKHAPYMD